ncbi:MAG: hypothetical protein AB8I08_31700 [Sandaracinaceae bacterium]
MRNLPHWMSPLLALLLGLSACVGSPQPSPPNLEAEFLGAQSGRATDIIEGVRVFGNEGSVLPAEGTVVVTVLDGENPPVAEPVRADGSFEVLLPAAFVNDEIRVQVRNGGARSVPLDRIIGEDELLVPERVACLTVEPEFDAEEVRLGERREFTVAIDNQCPEARTLSTRLRTDGAFQIADAPTELSAGTRADIVLTVMPTELGITEQTLFVEATAPTSDRRPVTLFVTGTP